MGLGADDYLSKPFDVDELMTSVKIRLGKSEAMAGKIDHMRSILTMAAPHQFRSPLNSILGFSEIIAHSLRQGASIPDELLLEYADFINTAGRRLLQLVERYALYAELCAMAVMQADRQPLMRKAQCLSWSDEVQVAVEQVADQCGRNGDIRHDCHVAILGISGTYWVRILVELVDNALKFSKEGAPVTVSGRVESGVYQLMVCDFGRGMTREQIAQIGPYVQFDRHKYEQQGVGLGLATVQKLMELHGGNVHIDSTPGEGTVVRVTLPVTA